jgi:hypothetical protein
MVTRSEKDDLLARIAKAQSVGATILSNMTAAKKIAEALPVDPALAGAGGVVFAKKGESDG